MSKKKPSMKQLESYLQDLDTFDNPKVELEQYATPPHIAALMLNTIDCTYHHIENKLVADLGCGTGRLSIGCLLLKARSVYGFDIDGAALKCGLQNICDMFSDNEKPEKLVREAYSSCDRFNFIQVDVANVDEFWTPWSKFFDTVIMNPPFGTKNNQGLDIRFLERAIGLSNESVYSLHKTSTREFILSKTKQWAVKSAKPIAQIRYNLDNTYKFHRRKSVDIDVDLWQIKI